MRAADRCSRRKGGGRGGAGREWPPCSSAGPLAHATAPSQPVAARDATTANTANRTRYLSTGPVHERLVGPARAGNTLTEFSPSPSSLMDIIGATHHL